MGRSLFRRLASLASVPALAAFAAGAPALAQDQDIYLTMTGIPSATVAPGGLAFVSAAWSSDRVNAPAASGLIKRIDGSMSLGAGFGAAETGIGLQFTVNISSLYDDFADSGYLGLRASRRISAEGRMPVYLGVNVENIAPWGDSRHNELSGDLIVSAFPVIETAAGPRPLMLTLGYGSHVRNYRSEPGVFAGIGMGLTPNIAVSAAWSGDEAIIGTGFRIDALPNMHFTASIDDAFDDNDARRLTLQVTWTTDKLFGGKF